MNEHPELLLADYVDDTLAPDDRARVEAHVRDCPSCREEVELAVAARGALDELPEVAPPSGLTFEVRRRARRAGGGLTWKIATGAAAAAVAIAGVVIALGPTGGGAGDGAEGGAVTAPKAERAPDVEAPGGPEQEALRSAAGRPKNEQLALEPRYLNTDRDYDAETIVDFGRRVRSEARASLRSGFRQPATDFYAAFDLETYPDAARVAVECLLREAPPDEIVVPYRLEVASFEGRPAYVGAFLQGADESAPYDRILLWVVDRQACTLRYFASFKLP